MTQGYYPGDAPSSQCNMMLHGAGLIVLPPQMMPPIFAQLLRQLDQGAPGRLDERFGSDLAGLIPALRRYAHSLTRDPDAAEDLVQDTLAKSWSARAQFEQGTHLRAWTFTILKRLFLSQRRRDRFQGDYDEVTAEQALAIFEPQTATLHMADVSRALHSLPVKQRTAIAMIAMEGLSYEQAAGRVGISLAAFKSRVSRARSALVSLLADEPMSETPSATPAPPDHESRRKVYRRAYTDAKASGRPLWIG